MIEKLSKIWPFRLFIDRYKAAQADDNAALIETAIQRRAIQERINRPGITKREARRKAEKFIYALIKENS